MRFGIPLLLICAQCLAQDALTIGDAALLVSTSSLRKNLVGYWRLEETAGATRLDYSEFNNHLTDHNNVGQTTGKVGNCGSFVAASTNYLTKSDNTSLSFEGTSFTFCCWVKAVTLPSSNVILSKAANSPYEWDFYYNGSKFAYGVLQVATPTTIVANTYGVVATNVWAFVVGWYDTGANTLNIQVNNGTVDSTACTRVIQPSGNPFEVGAENSGTRWNGLIDEIGLWKRVLTAGERTSLYNAGSGTHWPFAHP